jgi:fructokinase
MDIVCGGLEAGGTKFVCAVGSGPDSIIAETRFSTTSPKETIGQAMDFFREQHERTPLAAIGIGSFGPVDVDTKSSTYGHITSTPKAEWTQTDLMGPLKKALGLPVAFDTDVNAAALGEHRWGTAQDIEDFLYLTVGTGIGGGAMVNGQLVHGLLHPEMGHIKIPHDRDTDPYPGVCIYHGDCLEGLACGPAIEARWGAAPSTLPSDHPAWALEARYLGLALAAFTCVLSPRRILIGGGVMSQSCLLPLVRRQVQEILNGYIQSSTILDDIESFIVGPGLGERSGVLGAIALAQGLIG